MNRAGNLAPSLPDVSLPGQADPSVSGPVDVEDAVVEADALVEDDDTLVEEVSIDGMCGVY